MADDPEITQEDGAEGGAEDTQDETPALTELEQVAAEIGWKPKEQFKGDEAKWRPAADYIRQSKSIEDSLKGTVKELKGTVDRLASTSAKQTERALQQQAEHYEAMLEQAVEDGDKEAAKQAREGIRNTDRQLEQLSKADDPEERFKSDNPWYGQDDDATAYAVAISQREARKGASFEDQLKAAAEGVRKRFPELFDKQEQRQTLKAPPQVTAPSRSSSARRGTGYADLPADAKKAADSYAALFNRKFGVPIEKAKADYARDYHANRNEAA
jgi:hypothetical protein